MDRGKNANKNINPAENQNVLSQLFFLYMFPIFKKTYQYDLSEDDLFLPLEEHASNILGSRLEKIWDEEFIKNKKFSLHKALFRIFGLKFVIFGIIKCIDEVMLIIVIPKCIGKLVSFFETAQTRISKTEAYYYAGGLVVCLFTDCLMAHPTYMGLQHIAMKIRIACSSLIFRKMMKFNRSALVNTTAGHLINLLSNDVSKFDESFVLVHYSWIGPIQVGVGSFLLYREIGIGFIYGVVFLILFVPFQIWLAKRTSVLRLRTALITDERVRLMNELISGIQVIKMYCWEKPFEKFISMTRGYITAEKVFAVTAIYNCLRPTITMLFSLSISALAEINVSITRIHEVLKTDRVDYNEINYSDGNIQSSGESGVRIQFQDVCAKWVEGDVENTLKNINFQVSSNMLVAIVGPIGSGKTTILNTILKELPIKSGTLKIIGNISYAPQEPWLFAASVKDNILFGEEYEEDRYKTVIDICALAKDLNTLPHGDRTLVGERGRALSGGQKARISLARCVYKKADIYLLDDPLSAVDATLDNNPQRWYHRNDGKL
ncbi:probable multidrug resistance-associated protein lethal(2)03659 [Diorhabda sublineata]|uniref:probable multidrug resistance-associated protein lethal(2)03659 n=1 Tax=Diorhabda sublineata TaxID=1163346 RepID=UPI0024E12216|nr:probable multidrug resistance-associated protein lethal(2)03659 [Diorhabda sublineata]